ncbi:MAG: XRE family transcriptional regulator [Neisseria sp.]|nr:MAG: XRE family transcriptional regulator [Neisseria sp.]
MQNTKFKTLLTSAQITQADLSRRLGISPTSISKWHKIGVPQYAVAYLELLAKYNRLMDKI